MKNITLFGLAVTVAGLLVEETKGMAQGIPVAGPDPLPGLARPIFVNHEPGQAPEPGQPGLGRPEGPVAVPATPERPNPGPTMPAPAENPAPRPGFPGNGLGPRPGGGAGAGPAETLSLDDRIEAFFERFDLNGDGLATSREIERAREEGASGRAAMFIAENDFNQDGMVSLDELVMRAVDGAVAARSEAAAVFDSNGDGQITEEESVAVHQMRVEERVSQALAELGDRSGATRAFAVGVRQGQQGGRNRSGQLGRDARDGRNDRDDRNGRNDRNRRPGRGGQNGRDGSGTGIPLLLDSDDDGAVTRDEIWMLVVTLVGEAQSQFRERFDLDGDGLVSASEISAVDIEGILEQAAGILELLDTNGDNHISIEELERNPGGRQNDSDGPQDPVEPGQEQQEPVPGLEEPQGPGQIQAPGQVQGPDGRPVGGIRPQPNDRDSDRGPNRGLNRGSQGPSNRPGRGR